MKIKNAGQPKNVLNTTLKVSEANLNNQIKNLIKNLIIEIIESINDLFREKNFIKEHRLCKFSCTNIMCSPSLDNSLNLAAVYVNI